MTKPIQIIVLGGGTAGWMAAALMAKAWQGRSSKNNNNATNRNAQIRVIESPNLNIIGVGEGSTPQLKYLFDKLGLEEHDWMPKCHATYKHGILFKSWSAQPGFESYFHSFPAQTDTHTAQAFVYNCFLRRQQHDIHINPSSYFLPAWLAKQNKGPHANDNFPFKSSYGYHFDAHKVGEVLANRALDLGVKHTQDNISDVAQDEHGNITELISESGQRYAADFFIDATGFRSFLLQDKLGVNFHNYSDELFNDAAVVVPTSAQEKPTSHTEAIAMKHGWRWSIPLRQRVGNGYVYSSSFCSADQAEHELRKDLNLLDSDVGARHLKMRVGQVDKHWYKNCLAVGLSQGFLEPLEATALHLVQTTIEQFINSLSHNKTSPQDIANFNQRIRSRFDGIKDYIACHYKVNSRTDTDYWLANQNNNHISESLNSILKTWQSNQDLSLEIDRQNIADYYSTLSWHTLLAGYGVFKTTASNTAIKDNSRIQRFPVDEVLDFNRRCALNFSEHAQQLCFSNA